MFTVIRALLTFTAGSYKSANLKLRLAISLAQNLRFTTEPSVAVSANLQEEQRLVVWALYVMDKIAALSFDSSFALSDEECLLRLPEDEDTFRKTQYNGMPDLMTVKARPITLASSYATMVFAASVIGPLVILCHGGHACSPRFSSNGESTYALLTTRAKQLADVLDMDISSSNNHSLDSPKDASNERHHNVQYLYARVLYRLIQMFINHPFFVRKEINFVDSSQSQAFLVRSLAECQQQAEVLTRCLAGFQQTDQIPSCQLTPGYIIFNTALVHCMFVNSRSTSIANTSRELYEMSRAMLLQQALTDDNPRLQSYLIVLEIFLQTPGISDLLVDPTLTSFQHPSASSSYWRFLDFDWLCKQFCVDMSQMQTLGQSTPPSQAPSRVNSVSTFTSDSTSAGPSRDPSTPVTPDDTYNVMNQSRKSSALLSESTPIIHPELDSGYQVRGLAFGSISQALSLDEDKGACSTPSKALKTFSNANNQPVIPQRMSTFQQNEVEHETLSLEHYATQAGPAWDGAATLFTWSNYDASSFE